MTDNLKFGEGKMDSENYSINGFLTDIGQQVFWDSAEAAPGDGGTIGIPTPIIDKNKIIPIGPVGEEIYLSEIGPIGILDELNLDELAKILDIPLITLVTALTLATLLLPLLANIPLLAPFANIWARILGFFGYYRKREEKWGVIYDAETKKPIPLAVVQIFEREYNKLLNTQITDKEGRFSFLVQPGKYYLRATKKNYIFPSKMDSAGYHAGDIILTSSEIINYNIPLDPQVKTLVHRINILMGLQKFFNIIRIPLLVFGTAITAYVYINYGGTLNLVFLGLYAVIWIIELIKLRKAKPIGKTFDQISHAPLDLTILRLFNDKNKLVSTRVSDTRGRFSFLINPGDYYLTALKQDYEPYKTKNMQYSKSASIDLEIGLQKHAFAKPETQTQTESIPAPQQTQPTRPAPTPTAQLHPLFSQIRSQPQEKKIESPKIAIRPEFIKQESKPEVKQDILEPKPVDNNGENLYNLHNSNSSKSFWEPRRI